VSSASATLIDATTAYIASGDETGMPAIEAIIFPLMAGATELYRVTPGNPNTESFAFADSYSTMFSSDREDAVITYDGLPDPIIGPTAYLLAKDGGGVPGGGDDGWFLYNLTALGWTGTEQITITGLWPYQGSFSHISMYGTSTAVPEPSTMLLFCAGLIGFAGFRKKFRKA